MADFALQSTISISCPKRLTPYLKQELAALGFEVKSERVTGVEINGSLNDCMRLNLQLRCAHRIHFLINAFSCRNADELYKSLKSIAWEEYIPEKGYFSVTSRINNASIADSRYANLTVKDTIVDRIREKTGTRPDSGPNLDQTVVFLFWEGDTALVYLDTSGESISRRGYKVDNYKASMQESLAAALIMASQWTPGQHFINPMCGSGTLAIEAALMAANRAPGSLRNNFGFKHIYGFKHSEWEEIRRQVKSESIKYPDGKIIATDIAPAAIRAAQKNAQTAGVDHLIEFRTCSFQETEIPSGDGVILLNPPYGERMGRDADLNRLYSEIGDFFKNKAGGKWGYIFTANFQLMKKVGLRTKRRLEFYNSTLECRLLEYEIY